jgi:hypothetical protein
VVLFLLAFPAVPWAMAASVGDMPAGTGSTTHTTGSVNPTLSSSATTTNASTCLDRPGRPLVSNTTRVTLVQPIFTATPYSQYIYGSFYAFYKKHVNDAPGANITTDLKLLNTSVASGMGFKGGWGHSFPLYSFMTSKGARNCGIILGQNLKVISDINVTQGALFNPKNGSANFDVLVYGFAEYVSKPEYDQLVKFVAGGGRLIVMGGDAFQVHVYYNPKDHYETYVLGHGYAYNNKTAWRTVPLVLGFDLERFTGGVDCCFRLGSYSGALLNKGNTVGAALAAVYGNIVFKSYTPHEEDSVRNFSYTSIIGVFRNSSGTVVASYVHRYGKGYVVCFCVFADDVILADPSVQYLAVLAVSTPAAELMGSISPTPIPLGNNVINIDIAVIFAAVVVATAWVGVYLVGRRRGRS